MLKKILTFKDFNDQDRSEVVYFHLSESEVVDIVAATPEGIDKELDDALKANDAKIILDFIKRFVHLSYGIKSPDGLQFTKSPEILAQFIASPYYSDFLLGLIQNDGKEGQDFMRGILPPKLIERAEQKVRGEQTDSLESHTYLPSAREQFDQARPSVSDRLAPKSPARVTRDEPSVSGSNLESVKPSVIESAEFAAFQAWKAQQNAPQVESTHVMPAPPHEQLG